MKPMALVSLGVVLGAVITLIALGVLQPMRSGSLPAKPAPEVQPLPKPSATVVPPRDHNYDVIDGIKYGYTVALSDVQRQQGQVGNQVFMVTYAGERDGVFQIHAEQGGMLLAFECVRPCEVVKAMTGFDREGLRGKVRVEYVKNVPGMLAALALDDAMNGRLRPYVEYEGPRRWAVWVDSERGITRTRDREAEERAARSAAR